MNRLILTCAIAAIAATPATAQTFSPERIKADVSFLADDLLEGRDAGTRGYDLAARWVASRYEALGLQPGGPNGSWYQNVPFVTTRPDPSNPSALTVNGKRFVSGTEVIVGPNPIHPNLDESAEVVFVGYGLEDARYKLDDYRGLDVRGKVVVALYGAPGDVPSEVSASLNDRKTEFAERHGAAGLVTIATPAILSRYPWQRIVASSTQPRLRWVGADGKPHVPNGGLRLAGFISPVAAAELFKGTPATWEQISQQMSDKTTRVRGFAVPGKLRFERHSLVDKMTSPNVLGLLPGSDPKLANEVVMLTAHLDHNGIVPPKNGDKVMNGAMDNAAGVATMLEAARAFVESGQRPKRSILFVALTAEEDGLLGSEYLAEYPTLPGRRTVADVNLDMPILTYDFQDVVAFGAEHSTIGATVANAIKAINVTSSPDPLPQEGLFTRSDHYSFVKKGIPSVMLATGFAGPGKAAFGTFLAKHYHQPSDDLSQPFNWQAGAKFAKVNYLIARELADAAQAPRWYEGNFFGDKFAKDAPKARRP